MSVGYEKGKAPAFMLYPDKLLAGTDHLSDKAFRAYMRVLCWMWLHSITQFSCKNDESFVKRITRLQSKGYANAWMKEVMNPDHPLLREEGDMLISNGLRKEKLKQEKRSKSAQYSANERWKKANASRDSCYPFPIPNTTTTEDTVVVDNSVENKEKEEAKLYLIESGITGLINDPKTVDKILNSYPLDSIKRYGGYMLKQKEAGKIDNPAGYLQWALKENIDIPESDFTETSDNHRVKRLCPRCSRKPSAERESCIVCNGRGMVFVTDAKFRYLKAMQEKEG